MKKTDILFAFATFFITVYSFAQHTLVLHIDGAKSSKGNIGVAIYNSADSFLDLENVYRAEMHKAVKGSSRIEFMNLEKGRYAIALYHDENGNKVLDTNMLGIPKEEVAFSIGKLKMFGPPSFKECAFDFTSNMELTISLD